MTIKQPTQEEQDAKFAAAHAEVDAVHATVRAKFAAMLDAVAAALDEQSRRFHGFRTGNRLGEATLLVANGIEAQLQNASEYLASVRGAKDEDDSPAATTVAHLHVESILTAKIDQVRSLLVTAKAIHAIESKSKSTTTRTL